MSSAIEKGEQLAVRVRKKKSWKRILSVAACVVVFVTTYALILPAITMSKEAYCGIEEHVHDESCYSEVTVCGMNEGDVHVHTAECYQQVTVPVTDSAQTLSAASEPVLICRLDHEHGSECYEIPEQDPGIVRYELQTVLTCGLPTEPHVHSEACFESVLHCTLTEHTHTDECFVEPETADEAGYALPALTGDPAKDLLAVAKSQLGNAESEDGSVVYAKALEETDGSWNTAFAAWCLDRAEIPAEAGEGAEVFIPRMADAAKWLEALRAEELLRHDNEAKSGDLLFFLGQEDEAVKVSVVSERMLNDLQELSGWKLIVGDWNGKVAEVKFTAKELELLGYVSVPEAPVRELPAEVSAEETGAVEESVSASPAIPFNAKIWATVTVVENNSNKNTIENTEAAEADFFTADFSASGYQLLADGEEPDPLVLGSAETGSGNTGAPKIKWRLPTESEWHDYADGDKISANAELQITLDYGNLDPKALAQHGYKLVYYADDVMEKLQASGEIRMEGETRGVITATTVPDETGKDRTAILLDFSMSDDWVDSLGTSTLQGTFSYQGKLDLKALEESGGNTIDLAGIEIEVPDAQDATAQFAEVSLDKTNKGMIEDEEGNHYLEYSLKVKAGEYGSPDVKLFDTFTEGLAYVGDYVGVDENPHDADYESTALGPRERVHGNDAAVTGQVYLTNDTEGRRGEMPTPAENGANLAWYIGDMGPNEERTLTYRVEVLDNYIGLTHLDNDTITNKADLFSKEFPRGTDVTPYNANATANVSKRSNPIGPGPDGRYYIVYITVITADPDNDYVLTDVKYNDIPNQYKGGSYLSQITVHEDSFALYDTTGGTPVELDLQDYTEYTNAAGQSATRDNPRMNGTRFDVFVGDLAPGEVREIRYTMSIDVDAATAMGNGDIGIYNNGYVYSDEVRQNQQMNNSSTNNTLRSITWMNKQKGGQTSSTQSVTFPQGARIYDATGSTDGLATLPGVSGVSGYDVPGGAYEYRVVINQSGEWNVSATQWKDVLRPSADGNRYMQFIDYVRVDVYDTVQNNGSNPVGFNSDGTTAPKESVWVKIDGNWSFAFTGNQIGLTGDDAYILTYYTVAVTPQGVTSYGTAEVNNSFALTGNVIGPGGEVYYLNGINQSVTVTAKEPGVNDPLKKAWYYDANDMTFKDYHGGNKSNGALYWVIKMSGDKIPNGMKFQESTRIPDTNPEHYLRNDESLIGFYIINFDEGTENKDSADEFLTSFADIDEFRAAMDGGRIREVPEDLYEALWAGFSSTTYGDNGLHYDFTVTFNQDYTIGANEALYLIVRTDPVFMPGNGTYATYTNKCNYRTPTSNWKEVHDGQPIVGPQGSMDKVAAGIYTVKNNNFTSVLAGSKNVQKDVALDRTDFESSAAANMTFPDGTYLMWTLEVDKGAQMKGAYDIVDTLPEGVELVYIRPAVAYTSFNRPAGYPYYIGPDVTNKETIMAATRDIGASYKGSTWAWSINQEMPEWEAQGWTKHICASKCDNATTSRNATAAIYYTKGDQVRMHIPYMFGNRFDFQVLCRLTDAAEGQRLLGDVTLNNQATLYDDQGREIERDGAEITVTGGGVSKNLLMDGAYNQADPSKLATTRFPYTITINDERRDMISDSDIITIPFVDRMTGNMSMDLSTLQIYEIPAGASVPDINNPPYEYLTYYGGMNSDKDADIGKPWYDPARVGLPMGYTGSNATPIVVSTRSAVDAEGAPILDTSGSQMNEVVFANLPDSTRIVIKYSVSVTMKDGSLKFDNNSFWEGFEDNTGGDSDEVEMEYLAESEVSETKHGGVHVVKYDNDNITARLPGAVFGLYRAEYVVATQGYATQNGRTMDTVGEHVLAVYQGRDTSFHSSDPEIRVRYAPADRSIEMLEVITPNGPEWMTVANAQTRGYSFHHNLDTVDGQMTLCHVETLSVGMTDENGNLSYGFGSGLDYGRHFYFDANGDLQEVTEEMDMDDENRIHFNKIYAVVELEAPEGYVTDPTPRFFVMPNNLSAYNGQGENYFYRENWPTGVHVCTLTENGELTFMANIGNSRPPLTVSKDFAGSIGAYKPGAYTVGLWSENVERPTPDNMLHSVTLRYTEEDFGTYTPEGGSSEIYGVLPGHEKTMEFPVSLEFGTYYMYELNDSGYPIVPVAGTSTGTVSGQTYTVSLSGDSAQAAPGRIVYDGTHHDVTVTNTTYIMEVTKYFANVSGKHLDQGLAGTYRFGIWPSSEVDSTTMLPTTPVSVRNIAELSWDLSDQDASKTALFTGLSADTTYSIFELDEQNQPIAEHANAILGGTKYMVHYDNGNSGTPAGQTQPNVAVTNSATVILPSTGGIGNNLFAYSGAALMALGCFGYLVCLLRRRRRREDNA